MNPDQTLRIGARMNAALSLLTGSILAVAPTAVSDQLGREITPWLRVLGVGLIAHAGLLEWAARAPRPHPWVRLNVALVAPYPVAMLALALTVIEPSAGKMLLLLDGGCVAVVAAVQWAGLRRHGDVLADATATLAE